MSKAEDMLLIARVAIADDHRAFDALVKKYQSPIRRFLLNLTIGDSFLSDDLAQETFIKAYLNIRSFKGLSAFSTWLFRIAYNVFYDSEKTRKFYADLDTSETDASHTVSGNFSEEKFDLLTAMKTLKKEEQTAILLCYMEDKTHKEIAQIMNLPLGTVKTHILKGKKKIGDFLTREEYDR